jgi:hypothetical protein
LGEKELASVTTITGLADKSDALIPWAVNCAVDYVRDCVDRLIDMRNQEADPLKRSAPFLIGNNVWQESKSNWREVRDEAGDIGTQVHDLLEVFLQGIQGAVPCDIEAPNAQALELFNAATNKLAEIGPYTVLATEQKVVNEDEWYAGRFDALLEVDGETWLIDFKTGGAFYPEWGLQLAAYADAWEHCEYYNRIKEMSHNGGLGGKQLPPDIVDRIKVLRLDKKTLKAHWKEYGGEKDALTRENYMTAFQGLRDAFYVLKAKKAVKQAWLAR